MNTARYYEVKRKIEAILEDATLPRHLQVSYIIDVFDPQGGVDIIDLWPDERLTAREEEANVTDADPSPPKKTMRKKRAKAAKRRPLTKEK